MPTCGRLIEVGLCPKMKNHPLCGWIFIVPLSGEGFVEIKERNNEKKKMADNWYYSGTYGWQQRSTGSGKC